jgi:hypothetical protein
MPSEALISFKTALEEIADLALVARPSLRQGAGSSLRIARAAGRAQVVLLSSHFERYFYTVNEEAVTFLNAKGLLSSALPASLKLLHSKYPIEDLSATGWENRAGKLTTFIAEDGWLWASDRLGSLSPERLLAWLSAPKPTEIRRYYRYWNIDDIFTKITRKQVARGRLWLGVQELVDMRNSIAHGDFAAQPTQRDIQRYLSSARTFCERADREFARVLAKLTAAALPW